MNAHSLFNRLCDSPIPHRAAVTLVAFFALAWSSLAFCGKTHDAASDNKDPCATQKAEVNKLEQWLSYDRQHQNPTLATNQTKLAAANASLRKCQDASKDAASAEIAEFTKKLKNSTNPEDQKAAKALQDFLASAPEPQGLLWEADNLGWHTDKILEYSHEISTKPPFYSGPMPLEYTEGKSPGSVLFFHDFCDFRNQFKLDRSFIVMGARTVDKNGKLLAEARVRYYVSGNTQGRELEEFHYDPAGKVIFKCKSKIDPDTGFKIAESNTSGQKIRDYYFLWPTR